MQNATFNKINIDSANSKRERFNFSHNSYTTCGFGEVQPSMCKLCVPNSKHTLSMDSVVRLSPMVAPTYGDMRLKTWNHFIGMSELSRSFSKLLVDAPYANTSSVGRQDRVPTLPLRNLSCAALIGAKMTIYVSPSKDVLAERSSDKTDWILLDPTTQAAQVIIQHFASAQYGDFIANVSSDSRFPDYSGLMFSPSMLVAELPSNKLPLGNLQLLNDSSSEVSRYSDFFDVVELAQDNQFYVNKPVSIQSADLVFIRAFEMTTPLPGVGDAGVYSFMFCFRLSSFGKRIRKVLLGLGYQLNFYSSAAVNLFPLFAFYKAYFDSFGLTLYLNYESTNAALLLQNYDNRNLGVFDLGNATFCKFLLDLGTCFVTDDVDFISAHQRQDAIGSKQLGFLNNLVLDPNYNGQDVARNFDQSDQVDTPASDFKTTQHIYINKVNHSAVSEKYLMRLWKFTNRNTIAGHRIKELLQSAGFGKYVDEQKSNFIGYCDVPIEVSDVTATADSSNEVASSVLGEYVGKGIGYNKDKKKTFVFENDEFGYWITLQALVPNSAYSQSIDPTLYDVQRYDFYTRDFDALGYELSRKTVVLGASEFHNTITDDVNEYDASFGVVPRFSRYKNAFDVVNGDFSLRGTRDGYLPFILNKFINIDSRYAVEKSDSSAANKRFVTYRLNRFTDLPVSGNAWRYNSRYPWLNNFERIFASFSSEFGGYPSTLSVQASDLAKYELLYNSYDSFMIFNIFNFIGYCPMLPIEDSFGTTDEEDNYKSDVAFSKA